MFEIVIFSIITGFSYIGVEWFRRWSLRRNLYDVPNERSSHTIPTPRGGGLIIVLISLTIYFIYALTHEGIFAWSYFVGAFLVAGVSWLDDLYTVSFIWRFCVHVAAALLVIFSVGYYEEIFIPLIQVTAVSKIGGLILTFFWIVWLTNAYNFMDGIDGIAGIQAFSAGIGWLVIGKLFGADSSGFYGGVIAFTCLGFLIQNWQPAKIFMGDVGSAFLGYTFGVLPLLVEKEIGTTFQNHNLLPLGAIFLNWLFIFDTIYTFIKRLFKKERFWEAHRGHLYQRLVAEGFTHQTTAIIYGVISISTVLITILWMLNPKMWETFLFLIIGFQSIGILLCLYLKRKSDHKLPEEI